MKTAFDRIHLDLLYPPFADKLIALTDRCAKRGAIYVWTSGYRDPAEQARIYAIGRTTDKDGRPIGPGSPLLGQTVTRARPGQSAHEYRSGADAVRDANDDLASGLQPADDIDANYVVLAEEAVRVGLEAGYYWRTTLFRDRGHVQLPLSRNGISIAMLEAARRRGGDAVVLALLDKVKW